MGLEQGSCLPPSAQSQPLLASTQSCSSVRDAGSHLKLHEFGEAGAWILIWARTSDNWVLSPVILAVARAGVWMSLSPVPQFHHLYKQDYNISLRNLCCVGEKTLHKTKGLCNFKMLKILECFYFCVTDSKRRGSSDLGSHVENWIH